LKPDYADTYNSRYYRYRLEDYKGAMPIAFLTLHVYNHVWVYASDVG